MDIVNRFLRYVRIDTQSAEDAGVTPSTPGQMEFVKMLRTELEEMGLEEITLDEHGYLFATLPANTTRNVPTIGFIAHVDTSPDVTGKDVNPRIVEKYDGTNIVLSAEDQTILSTDESPELLRYVGDDLIVTDGHTLLGADDKAGVAEIMALAQRLSRIRKRRNISQQQLSERSNVSFGSIKRFETSGQISLISLTKLCVALDCVDEIKNLFTNIEYNSIDEVIRERKYERRHF